MTDTVERCAIVILAAGKGVRMGGQSPKVLVPFENRPLIDHVVAASALLNPERLIVVTGFGAEHVEETVLKHWQERGLGDGLAFARQPEQRGTGDAVRAALPALEGFQGKVIILYGDIPLISNATLNELMERHDREKATLSFLSFFQDPPTGYGRVIRDAATGEVQKIVENKDCSLAERLVRECNSGIYCVESAFLQPAVKNLSNDNAQGEFYLTDIVETAIKEGQRVLGIPTPDVRELLGINTPRDLATALDAARALRRERLLTSGVVFDDPATFFCDAETTIAPGVRIGPLVVLKGRCVIEADVIIEGSCYLKDTVVSKGALLKFGVRSEEATIGAYASVGPFAHLRPGSVLDSHVRIGNFVETKNAHLADGAKANHLSYLGDCSVGKNANIGAGTIFCNYNGFEKHYSTVGENVMIGSNSVLVAPVAVADDAYVAAGTVVKKDVPAASLSFVRSEQVVREGWTQGFRARFRKGGKDSGR